MPDGWESAGFTEITIPADAGPDDPRIYVGQNDPLAAAVGQDAAIVFYWADQRAFVFSVSDSGGTGDHGQLHIWGTDELHPGFHQLVDIDYDVPTNTAEISFAQGDGFAGMTIRARMFGRDFPVYTPTEFNDTVTALAGIESNAYTLNGGLLPGTVVASASDSASSGGIGAAETEIQLSINPMVFEADTAYRIEVMGGQQGSVANANPIWRFRISNGAATGALAYLFRRTQLPGTADTNLSMTGVFVTDATPPAPSTMALTMSALAGTVTETATFGGRHFTVTKLGDASLYPFANVLT